MRISELHLEGFGTLADLSLEDIPPGMAIIFGDNEAGKTTLLRFLRSVLFGLPTRLQKAYYPTADGSRKGGRIVVANDKEEGIVVERHEGKGSGVLTVTFPDGSKGGPEELRQIVGSATEELYSNVFAFGLAELQTFESLKTDKVKDSMYSAGLGVGARTIPDVMKELQKQLRSLFVRGGSSGSVNKLLSEIDGLGQMLRGHAMDQDEYGRIQNELRVCGDDAVDTAGKLLAARTRLAHIQRMHNAWELWTDLGTNIGLLDTLPPIEHFPEDGVRRLDILRTRETESEDQLRSASADGAQVRERLHGLRVNDEILVVSDGISELERGLDHFTVMGNDMASLTSEIVAKEQQLRQSLEDLGEGWGEHKLAEFDLSVAAKEEFGRCRRQMLEATRLHGEQRARRSHQQQQVEESVVKHEEMAKALAELPEPIPGLRSDVILQLRAGLESYTSAKSDLPLVETETDVRVEGLEATLRQIGSDWDESRLESFDGSLAVQDHVSTQQSVLGELRSGKAQAETRLEDLTSAYRDAGAELRQAEDAVTALPAGSETDEEHTTEQLHDIRSLRRELTAIEVSQSDLAHLEERHKDQQDGLERLSRVGDGTKRALPAWLAPLIAGVGVVGGMALWLLNDSWVTGIVLCAVFVTVAVIIHLSRTRDTGGDHESDIVALRESLTKLVEAINSRKLAVDEQVSQYEEAGRSLGISDPISHASIDELERLCEMQLARLRDLRPLAQKVVTAKQTQRTLKEKVVVAEKAYGHAELQLYQGEENWRTWLGEIGLPVTLSPEAAGHAMTRVDAARDQLREIAGRRGRIRQMQEKIAAFEAQVSAAVVEAGVKGEDKPEGTVHVLVSRLETTNERMRLRDEQERLLLEGEKRATREKATLDTVEKQYVTSMREVETCKRAWQHMMAQRGLAGTLSAEDAEGTMQSIADSRQRYDLLVDLRGRRSGLNRAISDYHHKVTVIMHALGRAEPQIADLGAIVPGLMKERDEAQAVHREADRLNQRIAEIEVQSDLLRAGLQRHQTAITELFSAAECNDEDSFRRNAVSFEKRRTAEESINRTQIQLSNQVGKGGEFSLLAAEFQAVTEEELAREADTLTQELEALELRQGELADEGGRLRQQLENLERSGVVSELRNQRQSSVSQLAANAEQWSVLKITEQLIGRAREKYERERQPGVLREAQHYFTSITDGAYTEIHAPLGDEQILVRTSSGTTRELGQLSTGTAEQLYLSLRFGFVKEFVQRSEPLPLIFDDILVNFDPRRARATGEAIVELAGSLQTLFFTCQPAMVALFKDIQPDIPVYHLNSGTLASAGGK